MNGNDHQTWKTASDDELLLSVAQGIKSADPDHIHSVELNYPVSNSLDDPAWTPLISLNAAYTYSPTYAELLHAYNQTNPLPVSTIISERISWEEMSLVGCFMALESL